MLQPYQVLRVINTLSIDVALGAVCCAAWFAQGFGVELRPYAYVALGVTVWIIYTADHLLDASKIKGEASTYRHRFHQAHFRLLALLLVAACVVDFTMLFFIRLKVVYAGIALLTIVVLYLLINRLLSFAKEFAIALVYSAGVLLPVISLRGVGFSGIEYIWIFCFFLTALINLIVFSMYDVQADRADGYNSFVLTLGIPVTKKVLIGLFLLQSALVVLLAWKGPWTVAVVLFAMNALLFLLFAGTSYFTKMDRYRLYGDVVFLFPVVFLIIG